MARLRPHFLALAAAVAIVLGTVGAVNLTVDVKGALRGADHDGPAAYARAVMASAHGLAWPERQERAIKAALAEASDADCYVVGTSHMQMVRRDSFAPARAACRRLTNLWVTQGTLEDVTVMLAALLDKPAARRVFVGVSPWLFKWGANRGWTENAEAYERARRRFGLSKAATGGAGLDGIANLLNYKYFEANVRHVLARRGNPGGFRPAADEDAGNLGDG
ncbi:MAG TPA: hypothetical protein VK196_09975, partial [Magnetospirillum sp.]|nr:hypothetical protein [Magnetospirillum sp.]